MYCLGLDQSYEMIPGQALPLRSRCPLSTLYEVAFADQLILSKVRQPGWWVESLKWGCGRKSKQKRFIHVITLTLITAQAAKEKTGRDLFLLVGRKELFGWLFSRSKVTLKYHWFAELTWKHSQRQERDSFGGCDWWWVAVLETERLWKPNSKRRRAELTNLPRKPISPI